MQTVVMQPIIGRPRRQPALWSSFESCPRHGVHARRLGPVSDPPHDNESNQCRLFLGPASPQDSHAPSGSTTARDRFIRAEAISRAVPVCRSILWRRTQCVDQLVGQPVSVSARRDGASPRGFNWNREPADPGDRCPCPLGMAHDIPTALTIAGGCGRWSKRIRSRVFQRRTVPGDSGQFSTD